jgi:hypothetical protein
MSLILKDIFDSSFNSKSLTNIPTPETVSRYEYLFTHSNTLSTAYHTADFSFTLSQLYALLPLPPPDRKPVLDDVFAGESHRLWFRRGRGRKIHVAICMANKGNLAEFRAWSHAFVLAGLLAAVKIQGKSREEVFAVEMELVQQSLKRVNRVFEMDQGIGRALLERGWDIPVRISNGYAHANGKGIE